MAKFEGFWELDHLRVNWGAIKEAEWRDDSKAANRNQMKWVECTMCIAHALKD